MMGGWGMGWFGSIFMFIFWGLVIVGLVLLIRWLVHTTRKDTGPAQGGSRAVDILNERYARGEIEREEFEQKKQDLVG
ncbi:MAG: SHOCT domain-containing protein [Deltaproteobacteria bacterium]|nr:SHOCT domain-containing protein [Deltaproteobacteria bacterium]